VEQVAAPESEEPPVETEPVATLEPEARSIGTGEGVASEPEGPSVETDTTEAETLLAAADLPVAAAVVEVGGTS